MKKRLNGPILLCALLAFAIFVVVACAAHYWSTGVFVTAQIALLYAALGAVGGLAILFRRVLLALFFYVGCGLGWLAGRAVAGLEGDFAPTAGLICTIFLIALFGLVGLYLEWRGFRRRRRKEKARREQQQLEEAERERKLLEEQQTKTAAPATTTAPATPAAPTDPISLTLGDDTPTSTKQ